MTSDDPAVQAMFAHLRDIATRVAQCDGDLQAVRDIIEDYSRLDRATREVGADWWPLDEPCGEWVLAPDADPAQRILYLHGGSWMSGSPRGYRPLAARLSRQSGCAVLVLDYRLAPEHPFPAALDDGMRAWQWLAGYGPQGQGTANTLSLAGDSAGGNLALALALRLKDEGGRRPDALVALSPAVDLGWGGASLRSHADVDPILRPDRLSLVSQAYVQDAESMQHPYVSPLFGDLANLPRTLIQVGDCEVLLDDARRMAGRLQQQDVAATLEVYAGMPHVFQLFAPTVAAASRAIGAAGAFVRDAVSQMPSGSGGA